MPSPAGPHRSRPTPPAPSATPAYSSPALEVLETLEIENALSTLESRLDSLEIDIARVTGLREDDTRRSAGELAVMRARVEDAVRALDDTARDARAAVTAAGQHSAEVVAEQAVQAARTAELQGSMTAAIERLEARMDELQDGMLRIAEHLGALLLLPKRMADLERNLEELSRDRASGEPGEPGA